MDPRSEALFPHVESDLVRVLRASAQEPQPFVVIQGLRTVDAEKAACTSGHSTTMHSRHLPDCNGLAAAVDVAALIDGKVSFAPGREAEVFGAIASQIKSAAEALSVPLHWGGDWTSFKDWGHFELDWGAYP